MAQLIKMLVTVLVVVFAMTIVTEVTAQTHHVLGGDGSWSTSSSGRVFRVGDKISFTYPATTEETILELETLEDFLACNLNNPIKMYTDGRASHVTLEKEGVRYFTSSNLESCKNGFKLPVPVQSVSDHLSDPIPFNFPPPAIWPPVEPLPQASPPPPPSPFSGSAYLSGFSFAFLVGLGLCFMGL